MFAYGLDSFFTRITPAKEFDRLSPEFNKPFLILTVTFVAIVAFLTYTMAMKKRLKIAWK